MKTQRKNPFVFDDRCNPVKRLQQEVTPSPGRPGRDCPVEMFAPLTSVAFFLLLAEEIAIPVVFVGKSVMCNAVDMPCQIKPGGTRVVPDAPFRPPKSNC